MNMEFATIGQMGGANELAALVTVMALIDVLGKTQILSSDEIEEIKNTAMTAIPTYPSDRYEEARRLIKENIS